MVDKHVIDEDDEIVTEDTILPEDTEIDVEHEEERLSDKLKAQRKKLAECEAEKQKYLEDLQRARADFLNSRRRLEEQLLRDKERATDKILEELLTLADSFDTAMADTALWGSIDAKWRVGVEAIQTKLMSILRSNNVTPIEPEGKRFNPEEHEAVSNTPVANDTDVDMVMTVLQKGYKRNDDILRPARVVVGTKQ